MNQQIEPPDSAVQIQFYITVADRNRAEPLWGSDPLSIGLSRVRKANSGHQEYPCSAWLECDDELDVNVRVTLYCKIGNALYSLDTSQSKISPAYMADARAAWGNIRYQSTSNYIAWLHPVKG